MELTPIHNRILGYVQAKGKATPQEIAAELSFPVEEAEARAGELVRHGALRGVSSDNRGFIAFMRPKEVKGEM